MKSLIKLVVVLLILGGIGYAGWMYFAKDEDENVPVIIEEPSGEGETTKSDVLADSVIVEKVEFKNKTDNKRVDCEYPKIISFNNANFQNAINTEIATNIQKYIQEVEYRVDDKTDPTELYEYVTTYEKLTSGKYLFLVISQDYQTGGIRSNKWKDIYSIDASRERIVYLEELFKPGVQFEKAIIDEITKQAAEQNIELQGGNGISRLPQKQAFYIKDDKLVIYFAPSMAAANVFGELSFEMPFTLNTDGTFSI